MMDLDLGKVARVRKHIVPRRLRDTLTRIAELRHETFR
jgi:hypothetical protein